MDKIEKMKDGTEVTVRLLVPQDIDRLMEFYASLPEDDRRYLKFNVMDRKAVAERLRRVDSGDDIRIVAVHGGLIVAIGALELSGDAWSKHQGEIRVIVAHPFQKRGLGTIMIRELYFIAVQSQIQTIVARMMRSQVGAQKICAWPVPQTPPVLNCSTSAMRRITGRRSRRSCRNPREPSVVPFRNQCFVS